MANISRRYIFIIALSVATILYCRPQTWAVCHNLWRYLFAANDRTPFWPWNRIIPWWRHQMETCSAVLAICAGNSPVPGEFPTQRPMTRSFDVYFDLRLNQRLCKQSWGWWFETLLCPLWRHSNALHELYLLIIYYWKPNDTHDKRHQFCDSLSEFIPFVTINFFIYIRT